MNVGTSERVPNFDGQCGDARSTPLTALFAGLACVLVGLGFPRHDAAQDSWEYSPYRIRVWLAAGPSAALSVERRTDGAVAALEVLARVYGGADVAAPPQSRLRDDDRELPASVAAHRRSDRGAKVRAAQDRRARALDKLMLLCVRGRARSIRPRVSGTGLPYADLRSDCAS